MTIRVFAVVCADAKVHVSFGRLEVYATKDAARTQMTNADFAYLNDHKCGPHRAITLAGEVTRL